MTAQPQRRLFSPKEIEDAYRNLRLDSEEARIRLHRVALPGEPLPTNRWRVEWGVDSPRAETSSK